MAMKKHLAIALIVFFAAGIGSSGVVAAQETATDQIIFYVH